MKILFCVLWYFAIAFAYMVFWAKFGKIISRWAKQKESGIGEIIFEGVLWPFMLPLDLGILAYQALKQLLLKIKNT